MEKCSKLHVKILSLLFQLEYKKHFCVLKMPEFPNDIIYGSQWCSGATKEKDELLPQQAIVLALLNWAFAIEKNP